MKNIKSQSGNYIINILPAGNYVIGDPCYMFNKSWEKILKVSKYFSTSDITEYTHDGVTYKLFAASTSYGDGTYVDNYGFEYCVDSGCLGIIPFEMIYIDKKVNSHNLENIYKIKRFENPVEIYYDGSTFIFNDIEIHTDIEDSYNDEEDEYEEDSYDDEEDE